MDPATRGDPSGPLRWTSPSARRLADVLGEQGHRVGERTVYRLLHDMGYSPQTNRRAAQHPDRDAQFNHIDRRAKALMRSRDPVVSVDTKKKELMGVPPTAGASGARRGRPSSPSGRIAHAASS